jgi:orotidine-5'-phosphate decarboxylase
LQYQAGIYRIANWSDITNAHPIPGEGIIKGLAEVGIPKQRGLLLLAEMSSKGNLCSSNYAQETYEMAKRNRNFVFGFIGQRRLTNAQGVEEVDFIYMTPGVGLHSSSDSLGQQYRTPQQVIEESGCDVIIVGRGIYASLSEGNLDQVVQKAEEYRKKAWDSYLRRISPSL